MEKIKDHLQQAETSGRAIGHFNIANLEMLRGIIQAAGRHSQPIFIGVSEGERDFIGLPELVGLIRTIREQIQFPVWLNADHTYSVEKANAAIDAGFDSVIIDGAGQDFDENVRITKEVISHARATRPDVLVEGELGFIGKSSRMLDELPDGAAVTEELITKPEEAREFVKQTGVDLLAPAVGTVHGMMKKGLNPKLHIDRIKELREAAGVPLVLHGGSGSSPEDIRASIEAGIGIIHVSTEIRIAYKDALNQTLADSPDELAPYKYLKPTIQAVAEVVDEKIKLFSGN